MKKASCYTIGIAFIGIAVWLTIDASLVWGQRGGGGGGARGGGAARGGGGGISRPPAGGGISRPPSGIGGGGISRPPVGGVGGGMSRPPGSVGGVGGGISQGSNINRSPSFSPPKMGGSVGALPKTLPGGVGGGVGGGIRDMPGVVQGPGLQPGTRPSIGSGIGSGGSPKIGGGPVNPGIGKGGQGIGGKPDFRPGGGSTLLPGLGGAAGAGKIAGKPGDHLGRRQEGVGDRKANITDRSQNLENRLDQRQDFRNQNQDQRQDFMNDRREDWQNWHDDYYGHHDNWYHGSWCEHWGNNWNHMWTDHTAAMVLGTTMWGLNRMNYWFGYDNYANPYYYEPLVVDNTTIYYSEPLAAPPVDVVVTDPAKDPAALPPGVTAEGMKHFEEARVSFYDGKYKEALASTNKALASMPKDALLHEFRALILFTMGNYKEAAMTLHPVLAVGPGWDWTTMSSLYPGNYTQNLRTLEKYVAENPKAADARFVLGYHYMTLGHTDNAVKELTEVQKQVPNDAVTEQLLQMLGKSPKAPEPAKESDVKFDAGKLVGSWNATRGGKATFNLTLSKEMGFTWTYKEGKNKQEVKGAYALNGNVLALEPDAGGVMLAEITDPQGGAFTFRVVGAPKGDTGLSFQRK